MTINLSNSHHQTMKQLVDGNDQQERSGQRLGTLEKLLLLMEASSGASKSDIIIVDVFSSAIICSTCHGYTFMNQPLYLEGKKILRLDSLDWMGEVTIDSDVVLEGDMIESPAPFASKKNSKKEHSVDNLDTLDEDISETLLRDLRGIRDKIVHITFPTSSTSSYKTLLKDWDLWGPLLMCTFFCLAINHDQSSDGKLGPHFAELFLLIWLGFYVVGINFKLLAISTPKRSKTSILPPPSIFQLICVFGYSLIGPCISIIVLRVIEAIISIEMKYLLYEKLFIGLVLGFIWPTYSAVRILSKYQAKEKRILAIYPIALYYFIVSWFIISAH